MTIEVFGFVKSLGFYGNGQVLIEIQIESSRMPNPHPGDPPTASFIAKAGEVDMYRPGMGVVIQIRPHPSANSGGSEHGE